MITNKFVRLLIYLFIRNFNSDDSDEVTYKVLQKKTYDRREFMWVYFLRKNKSKIQN